MAAPTMTADEILSKQHITCAEAAAFLGMSTNHLRVALEQGKIPVGDCVRGPGGRRIIHINPILLVAYKRGDVESLKVLELSRRVAEHDRKIHELENQLKKRSNTDVYPQEKSRSRTQGGT